jgi:hypothetical protein
VESIPAIRHGFSAPERVRFRDEPEIGGGTHDMSYRMAKKLHYGLTLLQAFATAQMPSTNRFSFRIRICDDCESRFAGGSGNWQPVSGQDRAEIAKNAARAGG